MSEQFGLIAFVVIVAALAIFLWKRKKKTPPVMSGNPNVYDDVLNGGDPVMSDPAPVEDVGYVGLKDTPAPKPAPEAPVEAPATEAKPVAKKPAAKKKPAATKKPVAKKTAAKKASSTGASLTKPKPKK